MNKAIPKYFEVRFRGLFEDGSVAILRHAETEAEPRDLVDLIDTEFPQWHDVHYVKLVVN